MKTFLPTGRSAKVAIFYFKNKKNGSNFFEPDNQETMNAMQQNNEDCKASPCPYFGNIKT